MRYDLRGNDQSLLRIGNLEIRYYVREPSPDNWNAIGIIGDEVDGDAEIGPNACRMIVGVGTSRDEAIGDLIVRVLSGNHPWFAHSLKSRDAHHHSVHPV